MPQDKYSEQLLRLKAGFSELGRNKYIYFKAWDSISSLTVVLHPVDFIQVCLHLLLNHILVVVADAAGTPLVAGVDLVCQRQSHHHLREAEEEEEGERRNGGGRRRGGGESSTVAAAAVASARRGSGMCCGGGVVAVVVVVVVVIVAARALSPEFGATRARGCRNSSLVSGHV